MDEKTDEIDWEKWRKAEDEFSITKVSKMKEFVWDNVECILIFIMGVGVGMMFSILIR